jgi:hypothetical protein
MHGFNAIQVRVIRHSYLLSGVPVEKQTNQVSNEKTPLISQTVFPDNFQILWLH